MDELSKLLKQEYLHDLLVCAHTCKLIILLCEPCCKLLHFCTVMPTCFVVHFGVHDDKLRTEFADAAAFQDGHQSPQVLEVKGEAGPPCFGRVLRTLHGAVKPLIPGCGVADEVTDVVRIWNRWLQEIQSSFLSVKTTTLTICWRALFICVPSRSYLDGGNKGRSDIGAEQRGHVQFTHVLLLPQSTGDALLAQELQAGHSVLHAHHQQRRPTGQEKA